MSSIKQQILFSISGDNAVAGPFLIGIVVISLYFPSSFGSRLSLANLQYLIGSELQIHDSHKLEVVLPAKNKKLLDKL